ncbi:hypothetical protein Cni_G26740 [Canna indica]|uniref:Uncharacterized protein n=1 Tax=Canna indica TaxID=4628 RepID=A0AAQ3L2R0_9LILI|nr:hypothetical protein Cni_G26740 [Canna indica]
MSLNRRANTDELMKKMPEMLLDYKVTAIFIVELYGETFGNYALVIPALGEKYTQEKRSSHWLSYFSVLVAFSCQGLEAFANRNQQS